MQPQREVALEVTQYVHSLQPLEQLTLAQQSTIIGLTQTLLQLTTTKFLHSLQTQDEVQQPEIIHSQ